MPLSAEGRLRCTRQGMHCAHPLPQHRKCPNPPFVRRSSPGAPSPTNRYPPTNCPHGRPPRLSQDLIPAAPKGARTICLPHFFSSRPQRGCGFVSRVLVAYKQAVFTPSYVLDTLPLQLSYNLLHAIKHMDMIQAYLYLNNFHTFPLTQFSQYKSDILFDFPVDCHPPILRRKHNMLLSFPPYMF